MRQEWVSIDDLAPWDKNPRKNDGEPVRKVAESLKRFGFVAPIVVWPKGNRIVAGHTRLKALRSLLSDNPRFTPKGAPGPGLARVAFHDFKNAKDADLYALADNRLNEIAEWDDDLVAEILESYSEDDAALAGFDTELPPEDSDDDEDVIPELAAVAVTKPGDLWKLGAHRLVCGDCRDTTLVELATTRERPTFGLHDPPYGIAIVEAGLGDGRKHGNAVSKRGSFRPIAGDAEPFNPSHLLPLSEVALLWGANHFADKLPPRASWIVWDKRVELPSNGFSDCELAWVSQGESARIKRHMWNGMIRASERGEPRVHPTQKPVVLHRELVEDYSNKGELVIDCYAGSGTTLIACEKAERRCSTIELDAHYCDVIVERWQRLTGKKATRVKAKAAA